MTKDKGVFCFMKDQKPCAGFHGVLEKYAEHGRSVVLSGPTSFAPIIRTAIEIVQNSGGQFHILVIISDGQMEEELSTVQVRSIPF